MSTVLGAQGGDGGGLDLLAVNRDADLLDLLARRAPVPAGDPVLALLAALAADVDEGLDQLLVAHDDDLLVRAVAAATDVPATSAPRRGLGLRATTVAIVVGATLSIGGVAAAVTGDPLAPVKGLVTAMGGQGAHQHPGKAHAFTAGKQAQRQIHGGDLAGARASLDAMKAELARGDLSKGDRHAIEARLAALEGQLARAAAGQGKAGHGKAGQGNADGQGSSGRGDGSGDQPTAPATKPKAKPTKAAEGSHGKPSAQPKATRTSKTTSTRGSGGGREHQAMPSATAADDSDDAPAPTADPATTGSGKGGKAADGTARGPAAADGSTARSDKTVGKGSSIGQ